MTPLEFALKVFHYCLSELQEGVVRFDCLNRSGDFSIHWTLNGKSVSYRFCGFLYRRQRLEFQEIFARLVLRNLRKQMLGEIE